jgi:SAM-dependent methyltransferase
VTAPEFDQYAASYDKLLSDPIRDCFVGTDSDFFHRRKCDLIRNYFRRSATDTSEMSYLDVGCGQGKLISLLRGDFARVAGCDVSPGMVANAQGFNVRLQADPCRVPFDNCEFDLATAVCVYQHVSVDNRAALTREIARVLKPGGTLAIVEHNPYNPVTRLIVSRSPVDRDACLLSAKEARALEVGAGLTPTATSYFLFFPEFIYKHGGAVVERGIWMCPLGGQYAAFGKKCTNE